MEVDCQEVEAFAQEYVDNILQIQEKLRLAKHITVCLKCRDLIHIKRVEKNHGKG